MTKLAVKLEHIGEALVVELLKDKNIRLRLQKLVKKNYLYS